MLGPCIPSDSTMAVRCVHVCTDVYAFLYLYLDVLCEEIGGAGGMLQIFPSGH